MVLYVVTVSYVAFCCLILGWLVATEDTVIEALVVLGGTYGTLLTGVPVLIAVLVAKQQLDANRRQHVATVKRSFKEQLDAIDEVRSFSRRIRTFPRENIVSILSKYDHKGDHLFTMPSHVGMQITPLVSNNIMTSVHRMNKFCILSRPVYLPEIKTLFTVRLSITATC